MSDLLLKWSVLLLAAVFSSMSARVHADTYPASYTWDGTRTPTQDNYATSQACGEAAYAAQSPDAGYTKLQWSFQNGTGGVYTCAGTSCAVWYEQQYPGYPASWAMSTYCNRNGGTCPYGGTYDGSQCVNAPACPAGQNRDPVTGQCVAPTCTAGEEKTVEWVSGWDTNGDGKSDQAVTPVSAWTQHCDGQCLHEPVSNPGDWQCTSAPGSQQIACSLTVKKTGGTCSASNAGTAPNPNGACAPGYVQGTVNGQTRCLASSPANPSQSDPTKVPTTQESTKTEQTVTNGDGSTTKTTTETFPDGSKKVTVETTGTDGSKESTTTTTGGQAAGENPQDKAFCEENPQLQICKTSTWAGACGAFVCDGDAVQCAIAKEQHARNCELWQARPLADLAEDMIAGNDPEASEHPAAPGNRELVDVGGILAAAEGDRMLTEGCPSSISIPSPWGSVTADLGPLCAMLGIGGNLLVALSTLAAVRIIGRG